MKFTIWRVFVDKIPRFYTGGMAAPYALRTVHRKIFRAGTGLRFFNSCSTLSKISGHYSPTKSLVPPTILGQGSVWGQGSWVRVRIRVLESSGRNKRFSRRIIGTLFQSRKKNGAGFRLNSWIKIKNFRKSCSCLGKRGVRKEWPGFPVFPRVLQIQNSIFHISLHRFTGFSLRVFIRGFQSGFHDGKFLDSHILVKISDLQAVVAACKMQQRNQQATENLIATSHTNLPKSSA